MIKSRIAAAVFGIMLAAAAVPGRAQNTSPEQMFYVLHEAIAAYERCERDTPFTQPEAAALNQRILELLDEAFGPGTRYRLGAGVKLTLIQQAKTDVARRLTARGCSRPPISEAVARYEERLAPHT